MGRKKKQKRKPKAKPQARPEPIISEPAEPPQMSTGRSRRIGPVVAMVVSVAAIVSLALWFVVKRRDGVSVPSLSSLASSDLVYEDFAGAETCKECHETQYEAWLTYQRVDHRSVRR